MTTQTGPPSLDDRTLPQGATSQSLLLAFDADGVVTLAEGPALEALGLAQTEAVGTTASAWLAGRPQLASCVRRALEGEQVEERFVVDDRLVDAHLAPQRDRRGEVIGVVGNARVDKLDASTWARFVASMSHDLRSPLSAIIGYSEMLLDDLEGVQHQDALKIRQAGRHMLDLVNSLVGLSRLEYEQEKVQIEQFDLREVVEEIVAESEAQIAAQGNTLAWQLDPSLRQATTDRFKLAQIFLNLLSSASGSAHNSSVKLDIEMRPLQQAEGLVIVVRGRGELDAARLNQALANRPDQQLGRELGGTGLGLCLASRFCAMLGGSLTVQSAPGEGCTLSAHLPLASLTSHPPIAFDTAASALASANDNPTVLTIDDDVRVHELIARTLQPRGFTVHTASSGEEGLLKARALRPDLITLDVLMPGLSGWEVLRALKHQDGLASTPVLMVSLVEDKVQGFQLGAAEYLEKPIDRQRLLKLVTRLAGSDSGAPRSVLVVDDEFFSREIVVRVLESCQWEVAQAENGLEALAVLEAMSAPPTVILLDLMMPEMDGFGFLAELRNKPSWRSIPVIVLSAKKLSVQEQHILASGAQAVLSKTNLDLMSLDRLLGEILDP